MSPPRNAGRFQTAAMYPGANQRNPSMNAPYRRKNRTPPTKVLIKLDFIKPIEGHNMAEFTLRPQGDSTQLTWAMHGPTPFVSKLVQVFTSMDSLIGKDFETGLANLKAAAEK